MTGPGLGSAGSAPERPVAAAAAAAEGAGPLRVCSDRFCWKQEIAAPYLFPPWSLGQPVGNEGLTMIRESVSQGEAN